MPYPFTSSDVATPFETLLNSVVTAAAARVQTYDQPITISSGNASGTATLTFTTAFIATPRVALTVGSTAQPYTVTRGAKTNTSVVITVNRPAGASTGSTVNVNVDVIAVEP